MPGKYGVRGDDGSYLFQELPAECYALYGQPSSLIVRKANSLAGEPFLQDRVFLNEKVDNLLLMPVHLAAQSDEEEFP